MDDPADLPTDDDLRVVGAVQGTPDVSWLSAPEPPTSALRDFVAQSKFEVSSALVSDANVSGCQQAVWCLLRGLEPLY